MSWALVGQITVLAIVGTLVFVTIYGAVHGLPNKNKENEK